MGKSARERADDIVDRTLRGHPLLQGVVADRFTVEQVLEEELRKHSIGWWARSSAISRAREHHRYRHLTDRSRLTQRRKGRSRTQGTDHLPKGGHEHGSADQIGSTDRNDHGAASAPARAAQFLGGTEEDAAIRIGAMLALDRRIGLPEHILPAVGLAVHPVGLDEWFDPAHEATMRALSRRASELLGQAHTLEQVMLTLSGYLEAYAEMLDATTMADHCKRVKAVADLRPGDLPSDLDRTTGGSTATNTAGQSADPQQLDAEIGRLHATKPDYAIRAAAVSTLVQRLDIPARMFMAVAVAVHPFSNDKEPAPRLEPFVRSMSREASRLLREARSVDDVEGILRGYLTTILNEYEKTTEWWYKSEWRRAVARLDES